MPQVFEEVILELGPNKVAALINEGAANMLAAYEIIRNKFPHIQAFRCTSHTLNLLAKDIEKLNITNEYINRCRDIIKIFKYQHIPCAILKRTQEEVY